MREDSSRSIRNLLYSFCYAHQVNSAQELFYTPLDWMHPLSSEAIKIVLYSVQAVSLSIATVQFAVTLSLMAQFLKACWLGNSKLEKPCRCSCIILLHLELLPLHNVYIFGKTKNFEVETKPNVKLQLGKAKKIKKSMWVGGSFQMVGEWYH